VLQSLQPVAREVESAAGAWFVVRIHPYRSFDGGNEGAVLTFVDNSEQHRAGEELREAKLAAEAGSVAKSNFLSSLSHEFRTPLSAMLGYADLLQLDGPLSEAQHQKVERIKVGGWHLVAMIDEILSFAKLDGGHEVVEPMAGGCLRGREGGGHADGAGRGCEGAEAGPGSPGRARDSGDGPGKVRQILINLCGNAVKYTQRRRGAPGAAPLR
jgi:signal transduction histidine kinase